MRILGAVALIALLAGPAAAQQAPHVQGYREADPEKTTADIAAEKAAEKAYKRSSDSIPDQKSADPWGTVRSDNAAPKAAGNAPPAKPKSSVAASKTAGAKSAAVKTDTPAK